MAQTVLSVEKSQMYVNWGGQKAKNVKTIYNKRFSKIHKFAFCQTSRMNFAPWEEIWPNPCRNHYKTTRIFPISIDQSTMKLLLLLLAFGVLLTVEARAKGP